MIKTLKNISLEKLTQKLSASIVYAILSSVALNFFFQPGHVYSSGITGLAQIFTTLSVKLLGFNLPVAVTLYLLNLPLLVLAWLKIGKRFTIYTVITVTLSSIFIRIIPEYTLATDPIINAVFGGAVMGAGVGYALRSGISSGGTDIISLYIRKKTGRQVGSISMIFNAGIMLIAGILFGWEYMLYSLLTIFVSSRVTDAIYTKQRKMQATIVTKQPETITRALHDDLHRGVTVVNSAEGAYSHDNMTILITIITQAEYQDFKEIMKKSDPTAFVSVAENVKVLGRFVEDES
ncbi:membrane protein [Lactococcus hodotermopsidis]|uniref:Membrane protein n=1 Tax=Pseudolactococcus hodotermopsidis TaxID=2709157 RepID=A0A6A0BBS5_9LACT|nr:YitT family protein [Lactococcus hodotermopsidis]GFH41921.1 membrane protein [Lactococcus hodotermopsidis]